MPAGKGFPLTLILTAIDRATQPINRINTLIEGYRAKWVAPIANPLSSLADTAGVSKVTSAFGEVAKAAGKVGDAVGTAVTRVRNLALVGGLAAYAFKTQFLDTGEFVEDMRIQLEGLYGNDAKKASEAMLFLRRLSLRAPFEFTDLAKAFRTLKGQGIDPMNGSLEAITEMVSRIGGKGDDLTGVSLQIGQAWSKTRLQAQDARIMVERGIPVWALLSRAVERVSKGAKHIDTAALLKLSADGQLGVKAIQALWEEAGVEFAGSNARMMKTFSGTVNTMKKEWFFFKQRVLGFDEVGEIIPGKLWDRMKGRINQFIDWIHAAAADGRLDALADRIGKQFEKFFDWLESDGLNTLMGLVDTLGDVIEKGNEFAKMVGGWGNLSKLGIAAYIGGPLVASIASLTFSLIALNGVLIGTPLGWIALAAIGIVLAIGDARKNLWELGKSLVDMVKGVFQIIGGIFTLNLEWITKGLENIFRGIFFGLANVVLGALNIMFAPFKWLFDGIKIATGGKIDLNKRFGTENGIGSISPDVPFQFVGEWAPKVSQAGQPSPFVMPKPNSGPTLNAAAAMRGAASPAVPSDGITINPIKVLVDFKNAPRGTRVDVSHDSGGSVNWSLGYAMGDAF